MDGKDSAGDSAKKREIYQENQWQHAWAEPVYISPGALCDWKEQCSADKCSDDHKGELIFTSFFVWKRYTSPNAIWVKKRRYHTAFISSDIGNAFDQKRYYDELKLYKKGRRSTPPSLPQAHPFQIIEEVLYHKRRENGEPFKNWLIAEAANHPAGWFIAILFDQCLFRDFIKKQGGYDNGNCNFNDEIENDVTDEQSVRPENIDLNYLREKIREIIRGTEEKLLASTYYYFQSCAQPTYSLTVEEIRQLVGVKKVFYDYKIPVLEKLKPITEEDFDPFEEIIPVFKEELYLWAAENRLCQAMDAMVKKKKRKKMETGPENSEARDLLLGGKEMQK